MTYNRNLVKDAHTFFKNMAIGNLYGKYDHLLVAPVSLRSRVLEMMDEEIAKGQDGYINVKINSMTDYKLMEKLKDASCAGVQVDMTIRGICCLIPELPGLTENIHVTSIVGRYLEHSRIYCFGKGEKEKMYISSADFMTRNTTRRVEIAAPVYDPDVRARIHHILDLGMRDNAKGRVLKSDMQYYLKPAGESLYDSQQQMMDEAEEGVRKAEEEKRAQIMDENAHRKSGSSIGDFFRRIFGMKKE
jgi:polyphosphate kinase